MLTTRGLGGALRVGTSILLLGMTAACTVEIGDISLSYEVDAEPAAVWGAIQKGAGSAYSLQPVPNSDAPGFRILLAGENVPVHAEANVSVSSGREARVSVHRSTPATLTVSAPNRWSVDAIARPVLAALKDGGISAETKTY
ncbi:MAG: hypothetical protein GC161_01670 [Planctomycetaceae bacterium]|nr:hypothetical protein [Planctomycetaceae bacterium]